MGARIQFAAAAVTHGLFASTTIGLIVIIALAQTVGVWRGDARLLALARAWAAPYVAVYALGIVAGMLLETQFGLNWSGLIDRAGNVVGAPFTIETLSTFVAESTLLALWTFGWDVLRPKWHLAIVWGIVLTALLSVFWSLAANGFLQHPRGYRVVDGTLVLTDFAALLRAPSLWIALLHIVGASLAVGAALVAGVGAARLRRQIGRGEPSNPVDVLAIRSGSAMIAIGAALAVVVRVLTTARVGCGPGSASTPGATARGDCRGAAPSRDVPSRTVDRSHRAIGASWCPRGRRRRTGRPPCRTRGCSTPPERPVLA